ncbi:MAG TPA: sigma-70 family RNA polymerase sigma factor [Solirubrobacteraceae bacterium]|nr:sigma-70 family RNA polymerase sigma factor [Solirubrobacteraceae bacterium]
MADAGATTPVRTELDAAFTQLRPQLTGYCYRMMGSAFEADDAVQETMLRAWRSYDTFEGRAALSSWLYRIATNVCLTMLDGRNRRARPMDIGGPGSSSTEAAALGTLPEGAWIEPIPTGKVVADVSDPAELAQSRETLRLAFVAALQVLPPRQRAVLILREVLRWKATEVAELLDTSVASVNSALQRARATLADRDVSVDDPMAAMDAEEAALLVRYVEAFEDFDMDALVALLHEDATMSMPPFDLWLQGADEIKAWNLGTGSGCRGSRLVAIMGNGMPGFAQYRVAADGGFEAWGVQLLDIADGQIVAINCFLDVQRLFPLFGIALTLDG